MLPGLLSSNPLNGCNFFVHFYIVQVSSFLDNFPVCLVSLYTEKVTL